MEIYMTEVSDLKVTGNNGIRYTPDNGAKDFKLSVTTEFTGSGDFSEFEHDHTALLLHLQSILAEKLEVVKL